jgi:secreted trypsin-like serine protease
MRRSLVLGAAVVATLMLAVPSAHAITYGERDGNDHPNVGALIIDFADDDEGPRHICSGTLIDEDVFLTAAHCTSFLAEEDRVFVSFAVDVDPIPPAGQLHEGSAVTNPGFNQRQSDPGDIAVVLLDEPVAGLTPAELPTAGLLDQMKRAGMLNGRRFTAVGYGVHEPEVGGGPPRFAYDGERWRSVSEFNALNRVWLRLSQNDATSDGGTCFGDSGGPNFLGAGATETGIIASITVTGDAMCLATNVTYRLDTASARGFLDDYVAVP